MIRKTISLLIIILTFCGCQTIPLAGKNAVQPQTYKEVMASDTNFNLETGEIKYTLAEDAKVRIRIGIRDGGPVLRTLVDWEQRSKGTHREVWDSQDASGQVLFERRTDLMVALTCLAPGKPGDLAPDFKGYRNSPDFAVTFPEVEESQNNLPVVQGTFPVRVTIAQKDMGWLRSTKFEISFFFDQTFLFEDEEGSNPYTFLINTAGINAGEHVVTVNVVGYEGEIGTKSVKIYVKAK